MAFNTNITLDIPSLEEIVSTRVSDASFVLAQLGQPSVVKQLVHGTRCESDVSKAAMYGHSLGGATAVAAVVKGSRLLGGADMDGTLFLINQGIYKPVILFGREDHNRSTDTSWPDALGYFGMETRARSE